MMKLIIDTNRYVDLMRGVSEAVEVVSRASEILLPFVVVAELRAGFALGNQGLRNEATLAAFLAQADVVEVHSTDATTRTYAELFRQLRSAGTPIPTNDLWIAAITLEHGASLLTRDAHFAKIPQIPRL